MDAVAKIDARLTKTIDRKAAPDPTASIMRRENISEPQLGLKRVTLPSINEQILDYHESATAVRNPLTVIDPTRRFHFLYPISMANIMQLLEIFWSPLFELILQL